MPPILHLSIQPDICIVCSWMNVNQRPLSLSIFLETFPNPVLVVFILHIFEKTETWYTVSTTCLAP